MLINSIPRQHSSLEYTNIEVLCTRLRVANVLALHREGRALSTDELTDKGTLFFPPLSGFMQQPNQTRQLLQLRVL